MGTSAGTTFTLEDLLSRAGLAGWAVRAAAGLRKLGPYAAIEILLPGGSVFSLLLWLYRRHKVAEVVVRKWCLFRKSLNGLRAWVAHLEPPYALAFNHGTHTDTWACAAQVGRSVLEGRARFLPSLNRNEKLGNRRRATQFPVGLLLTTVLSLPCTPFASGAAAQDLPKRSMSSIVLTPCKLPGWPEPARCGVLDVAENPNKPSGRRLQIGVAVIPATEEAQADPLVPLMGGPGEAAISEAAYYAKLFAPLRRDHDILLVDQRGTGRSAALRCELYSADDPAVSLRDLFPPAAVKRCEQQLSARADLTQYTYVHFANDLEQVRRSLGYEKMNLFGGSYGTRAAQVLMRAYPQSVRTAYLGSVVPIDVITPLTMARSAQVALDNTLGACAAESACNTAFPNLREEFRQVVARLDAGKVRVAIPGRSGTFPIDRGRVMEWFRSLNYRPGTAAGLPWMIHRAYMGDFSPFVEGVLSNARSADAGLSFGLFFSITCNDDVVFMLEEDIVRETQGTFLGDYRARQQQGACKQWPRVSYPADYRTPVHSEVPTLFVSGDLDGASPLWMTEHAAPGFSNRRQVVLSGKGHTEVTECIPGLYDQFVRSGDTHGLDSSACRPVPRPPFETHSP